MPQVVYCNGSYQSRLEAGVSFEDRGFQFADGVYEVIWLENGVLVDLADHLARLRQSATQLQISGLPDEAVLTHIAYQTVRRNFARRGGFYIQASRGVAERNHSINVSAEPSVVMAVYAMDTPPLAPHNVVTIQDFRWKHCHIKATALIASVMARSEAEARHSNEAWYLDENSKVLEGSASNAWIVDKTDTVITAPLSNRILSGITRKRVLKLIKRLGLKHKEAYFSVDEAKSAKEAFYTSTTRFVQAVGSIDQTSIGSGDGKGKAGKITTALYRCYVEYLSGG